MTETIVAVSLIVAFAGIVAVDFLAYRREQDAKKEMKEDKEKLKDEIHNGHNISRIQSLAGRVRD